MSTNFLRLIFRHRDRSESVGLGALVEDLVAILVCNFCYKPACSPSICRHSTPTPRSRPVLRLIEGGLSKGDEREFQVAFPIRTRGHDILHTNERHSLDAEATLSRVGSGGRISVLGC